MTSANPSFFEVITQAVQDMATYGFDSEQRMQRWVIAIRQAAERDMRPEADLDRDLKRILTAAYERHVERGGIWKYHPQVSAITKASIKPKLRDEFDRRMMTSRGLIKRNRERANLQTEQRFIGWASSIPAGGSSSIPKVATKLAIRKALTQLPYEERRVLIDQGLKFTAAVSNIIAVDGGAIAAIWHSHWREPGYQFRIPHKERDLHVYAIKGNWAIDQGLMKVGPDGYYEDTEQVGTLIYCRCYAQFLYGIRQLPEFMVTQKGLEMLRKADSL